MNRYFMVIVLVSALLTCSCIQLAAREASTTAEAPKFVPKKMKVLTETQKAWALAASAILAERNGTRHDQLNEIEPTDEAIIQVKKMMYDTWRISNRQTFWGALKWVADGGHRKPFEKLGSYLATLDAGQYAKVLAKTKGNPEAHNQLLIANKYYKQLGQKSLMGWDYSQYISLCRWGHLVGYLTENETWALIMEAAKELRQTFSSWRELGENFLIGREFWAYNATKESEQLFVDAFNRLLNDSGSCWNRIPWDIDLTEVEVPPEARPATEQPTQPRETS